MDSLLERVARTARLGVFAGAAMLATALPLHAQKPQQQPELDNYTLVQPNNSNPKTSPMLVMQDGKVLGYLSIEGSPWNQKHLATTPDGNRIMDTFGKAAVAKDSQLVVLDGTRPTVFVHGKKDDHIRFVPGFKADYKDIVQQDTTVVVDGKERDGWVVHTNKALGDNQNRTFKAYMWNDSDDCQPKRDICSSAFAAIEYANPPRIVTQYLAKAQHPGEKKAVAQAGKPQPGVPRPAPYIVHIEEKVDITAPTIASLGGEPARKRKKAQHERKTHEQPQAHEHHKTQGQQKAREQKAHEAPRHAHKKTHGPSAVHLDVGVIGYGGVNSSLTTDYRSLQPTRTVGNDPEWGAGVSLDADVGPLFANGQGLYRRSGNQGTADNLYDAHGVAGLAVARAGNVRFLVGGDGLFLRQRTASRIPNGEDQSIYAVGVGPMLLWSNNAGGRFYAMSGVTNWSQFARRELGTTPHNYSRTDMKGSSTAMGVRIPVHEWRIGADAQYTDVQSENADMRYKELDTRASLTRTLGPVNVGVTGEFVQNRFEQDIPSYSGAALHTLGQNRQFRAGITVEIPIRHKH